MQFLVEEEGLLDTGLEGLGFFGEVGGEGGGEGLEEGLVGEGLG